MEVIQKTVAVDEATTNNAKIMPNGGSSTGSQDFITLNEKNALVQK